MWNPAKRDVLVTPAEAAKLAGGRLTPAGFVAAAERGALPVAVRTPSGRRLFEVEAVRAFIAARTRRGKTS
jgi:hypothetical protein